MSNSQTKSLISEETAKAAATYWAQYLPGVKAICFSDIDKHSKISKDSDQKNINFMSAMTSIARQEKSVTKEQYEKFIDKLAAKIIGKEQVQLGDSSNYHPPVEVVEALKEAGIDGISPFGIFPYKTMMKISANEEILVDYEPIENTHYTCSFEAKEASFEIKLMLLRQETNIYTGARDIGSVLAEIDLGEKCKDSNYDDSYSKTKLIKFGLYPWDTNDQPGIIELCNLFANNEEF